MRTSLYQILSATILLLCTTAEQASLGATHHVSKRKAAANAREKAELDKADAEDRAERAKTKFPYTTADNFQKDVLQSTEPVLVDFSASWCAPCKAMTPYVNDVAAKYAGKLKVFKVDIDDDEDLADDLKVESVPTFMLFNHGKIVKTETGNIGATKLEAEVSEVLTPASSQTAGKDAHLY